jgi:hypothetical protein
VCGTVTGVWAKPHEDVVIAGVANQGLWASSGESSDGGMSWQPLGTGKGADAVTNAVSDIVFDPDHPEIFWESGIHTGVGVYQTNDSGKTFVALAVMMSDSISIDFGDQDRKTMLAGSHESGAVLFLSQDSGAHFTNIGNRLPNGNCTTPVVVDAQTLLLGCNGYSGNVAGVIRSTDVGQSWTQVSNLGGSGRPLRASDHSLYWRNVSPSGIARSTDDGLTWVTTSSVAIRTTPVELPDGRIAALSTEQRVVISSDRGKTWKIESPPMEMTGNGNGVGLAYSAQRRAFFGTRDACAERIPVPEYSVMRYDFDYETR